MLKKERDDTILLEPQPNESRSSSNNKSGGGAAVVRLNPHFASLTSPSTSTSGAGPMLRGRIDSDGTAFTVPTDYHFNHVLPETTSQDKIYYTLGLPIATASMSSLKNAVSSRSNNSSQRTAKGHLIVGMGVVNSGKTYTCLGGPTVGKRRGSQDGIVPRLLDSLFSQSKHYANADGHGNGSGEKGFTVQISMMQVMQPKKAHTHDAAGTASSEIHDLLAGPTPTNENSARKVSGTSPQRNFNVRNIAARFEVRSPGRGAASTKNQQERTKSVTKEGSASTQLDPSNPKPSLHACRDISQAREVIQNGLAASQRLAKGNQNMHLYITMQPALDGKKFGDKIAILDMAGLENEKRKQTRGKDSVASVNQAANAAVLHCLRTMKYNGNILNGKSDGIGSIEVPNVADDISELSSVSQIKNPSKTNLKTVPFRQHAVTMLLSPFFTKSVRSAKVTVILAAYPGHSDLSQKRTLLQDIQLLHGSIISNTTASPSMKENFFKIDEDSEEDYLPTVAVQVPKSKIEENNAAVISGKGTVLQDSDIQSTVASDFPGVDLSLVAKTDAEKHLLQSQPLQKALKIQPSNHRVRKTKHSISPRYARAMQVEHEANIINHPSQNERLQKNQIDAREYQDGYRPCAPVQEQNEDTTKPDPRIKILEDKLQKVLQEKNALQQLCSQLEQENADLKIAARESGRKALQTRWTDQDEKEFQDSRRLRREDQTLIKAPIRSHLEKVNNIYEIKNQWCMTNKPHFSLQLPTHFKRAEELNIRDKENKEKEEGDDTSQRGPTGTSLEH